ncbi:hypothetical protein BH23PLA1_BH23PLA1_06380 [soil metagenome]
MISRTMSSARINGWTHQAAEQRGKGMPASMESRMAPVRLPLNRRRIEVDLASQLHGQIMRKSHGQIRELKVVCTEKKITLQGRSPTHYVKQLAQEAVLELIQGSPALANHILVR